MSLIRNTSYIALSRLAYTMCNWLALVAIARFASPAALGEFTYSLAIITPIIIFSQFNLRAYIATDTKEKFSYYDYIFTRIITVFSILIVIMMVLLFSYDYSDINVKLLGIVAIYKSIESISDIYYGILQKKEKMLGISISVFLHGITYILCMAILVFLSGKVIYGASIVSLVWLLLLLFFDGPSIKRNNISISTKIDFKITEIIKCCWPLGVILTLINLRVNIPIYFIKLNIGVEEVGVFSLIGYFIVAGNLISGSLLQAVAPSLAQKYNSSNLSSFLQAFTKIILVPISLGGLGVLIAFVFGEDILTLLYGDLFRVHGELLIWVMIAASIGYLASFFGLILTIARKIKYQLIINIIGALITLFASFLLIPDYGLVGGAMAIMACNLFVLFFNTLVFMVSFFVKSKNRVAE